LLDSLLQESGWPVGGTSEWGYGRREGGEVKQASARRPGKSDGGGELVGPVRPWRP